MKTLTVILLLLPSFIFAEKIEVDTFLVSQEALIGQMIKDLRSAPDDGEKESINIDLQAALEDLLEYPGVVEYPFESWNTISTITSPDGAFRIFNWNVEDNDMNHSHFCYVVKPTYGSKPNKVYKFKEDKITLPPRPDMMLTPDRWYGALYYKILPVQRGNKTYYTVLGYSGKDRSTNMKILEVFYFKGRSLRLGHPMFQESAGSKTLLKRVFFEYSEKAVVSVNINEKLGGIVFDHLVPEQKNLEGLYSFYIPDMTYDAYRLDDGIWRYNEDVIAYNDPNKKVKQWRPTEEGNNSEFEEVKDFWINPVDNQSPNGGGTDATAPIEDFTDGSKNKKNRKSDKDKRRRFKLFKKKKKNRSAIGAD